MAHSREYLCSLVMEKHSMVAHIGGQPTEDKRRETKIRPPYSILPYWGLCPPVQTIGQSSDGISLGSNGSILGTRMTITQLLGLMNHTTTLGKRILTRQSNMEQFYNGGTTVMNQR
jgi:hypothetical protein